jgi:inner membrane protein
VDKIEGTPSGVEPESVQARDIERFRWFSDDFLAKHPSHDNVIGDVRYAVLPDDIHPLWGIVVDPSRSNEYVAFENFREMREGTGRRILQRMLGKDLEK